MLIVKIGKKTSRFVLAVIPGNARVEFAATDVAERLAGSVADTGAVLQRCSARQISGPADLVAFDKIGAGVGGRSTRSAGASVLT